MTVPLRLYRNILQNKNLFIAIAAHVFYRKKTLREKCPYSELFWPAFSRIRTEYGEIRSISPSICSSNAEKYGPENSEYGLFSRSV